MWRQDDILGQSPPRLRGTGRLLGAPAHRPHPLPPLCRHSGHDTHGSKPGLFRILAMPTWPASNCAYCLRACVIQNSPWQNVLLLSPQHIAPLTSDTQVYAHFFQETNRRLSNRCGPHRGHSVHPTMEVRPQPGRGLLCIAQRFNSRAEPRAPAI